MIVDRLAEVVTGHVKFFSSTSHRRSVNRMYHDHRLQANDGKTEMA